MTQGRTKLSHEKIYLWRKLLFILTESLSYVQTDAITANIVGSCCSGGYWMQHCCATLPWSRNKRNGSKAWQVVNFAQQLPTTHNNTQQGMQTDATCHTQQCWELLHGNVRLHAFSRDMINTFGITDVSYWIGSESQRWVVFLDAVSVVPESYINHVPIGASVPVELDKVSVDIYQQYTTITYT